MKKNSIFLSIVLGFSLLSFNSVHAADYIWPIGGDNAYETFIEYGYEHRTYNTNTYNEKYNYEPMEKVYGPKSKCSGQTTCGENHYGVDITGVKGNTYGVVSVSDGMVLATSSNRWRSAGINFIDNNQRQSLNANNGGGYGNYVIIQETSTGRCFLYAHLRANSIFLKQGDTVKAGQIIGTMGSSGDAGHMHLHFEVRPDRKSMTINYGGSLTVTTGFNKETVDPRNYIGYDAPAKPVQPEPEVPVEEPAVVEPTPLPVPVVPSVSASLDSNVGAKEAQIYIRFDGKITVNSSPVVNVTIGNQTIAARYVGVSVDGKSLSYQISFDSFDVINSGNISVSASGGDVRDFKNEKVNINLSGVIGSLKDYTITDLYKNIISKQAGDIDLDGYVDARDASILMQLNSDVAVRELTAEEKKQYSRGDVNGDGVINVNDVSAILEYSTKVGVGVEFGKLVKCDANNDDVVDKKDYYMFANALNSRNSNYDLDGNGVVDNADLAEFKRLLKKHGYR